MALTRILAVHTYTSVLGNQTYTFDVTLDGNGVLGVRNIRSPFGQLLDPNTPVPDSVMTDISNARAITRQQLSQSIVTSGTMSWTGQTSQTVTVSSGLLNNTNYMVAYTTPDGTILTTSALTTTSFLVTAPSAYGSSPTPIPVPYVVLVATQQASTLSGTLTFTHSSGPSQSVTFATPMLTSVYRIMMEPSGFFYATVTSQTTTGFTMAISYTPASAETVTVGYDIFV